MDLNNTIFLILTIVTFYNLKVKVMAETLMEESFATCADAGGQLRWR